MSKTLSGDEVYLALRTRVNGFAIIILRDKTTKDVFVDIADVYETGDVPSANSRLWLTTIHGLDWETANYDYLFCIPSRDGKAELYTHSGTVLTSPETTSDRLPRLTSIEFANEFTNQENDYFGEIQKAYIPIVKNWTMSFTYEPFGPSFDSLFFGVKNHNGYNYAVAAVDTGLNTISVATDVTAYFAAADTFMVNGSTGNDGDYTVVSSTYSAPNTIITVANVTDATVDGTVTEFGGNDSVNTRAAYGCLASITGALPNPTTATTSTECFEWDVGNAQYGLDVALIFGSATCPPWEEQVAPSTGLYEVFRGEKACISTASMAMNARGTNQLSVTLIGAIGYITGCTGFSTMFE